MREPANNQHGSVKRFTYNGPNSKSGSKDNSLASDDWFSGRPAKAKSEQSLLGRGRETAELDDVWSIRKNVSASLTQKPDTAVAAVHPSNTGFYSRHGQYNNKSSKLNEDPSGRSGSDDSTFGSSGGYSYGQSRSNYSYAGGVGAGPGQTTSPRFSTGPNATQGQNRGGGIGPPLISGRHSPTRSIGGRSQASQHSRGKASDTWSSF